MRIYKYPLEVTDRQEVFMPMGATLLTAQMQHGILQLWSLVDENEQAETARKIAIFGTGNPMPDDPSAYLATFQMSGGALVFHVFELP